jgi:endonuclease/exonuclease/phosphatase family metal-dependent hydrolase
MTAPVRDPAPGDRARDPGHPPGRMPAAPRLALIASLALACATDPQATSADDTSGEPGTSSTTSTDSTSSTSGDDASTTTPTTGAAESSTGEVIVPPLGPWRVMTFNVMCSSCAPEGFEDWEERVPYTGDTVRRHDPDLIGFQELFNGEEVAQIEAELPDYTTIWFAAADPGDLDYADATIAYRSSMFAEVEHGFYWLSPTPDTPYSNGFASPQLPRLVVWARLRALAEDHEFVFATTHFDNNSPSQELSAPLVLERTAALADELPVIMVGDFNSKPGTPAYALLTDGVDGEGPRFADAFVLADEWRAETNLAPMPAYDPAQRIDHVFVAGAPWQGADWVVDQWGYGPTEHYTSDHFAIAVTVAVP